jgi:hypothetical protein
MAVIAQAAGGSRGRTVRSGFGRPGSGRHGLAIAAAFAVLLGFLAYGIYGAVKPSSRAVPLPKGVSADHLVVGTYASPAITVSGDDVRVETPSFSALAVVTGPLVPGEGFTYQPRYVAATWTVHIFDVTGTIPLAAKDFDNIDHLGTKFTVEPPLGTTMPTSVTTGGQVTFQLRATVPIGENLFRWAPNGNNIVAKWDNQVEND